MNKVFFTNGGADANENAIRMARLHTGRRKVMSFYRSYHGNTGAAIAATGDPRRWPNEFADAHIHFFGPYAYRSSFWATDEAQESERALPHLEQVITFEGPATIAAILIETVVGTAGVLIPPPGYLEGVRALCDKHGIVLILDEVMAGFGRSGDVVRVRELRRQARPHHLRQGLATPATSRSAASSSATRSPRRSTTASSPAASPTPATRWPAPPSSRRSTR